MGVKRILKSRTRNQHTGLMVNNYHQPPPVREDIWLELGSGLMFHKSGRCFTSSNFTLEI